MSFQERVDAHRAEFNKSDVAIVDVLLSNPAEAALWRGEDVASRARVHPSAVTRTSKKLGYKGFLELRADLREMHNEFISGAGERVRSGVAAAKATTILEDLISKEVSFIQQVADNVKTRDIELAADLLIGARKVYVYGRGASTAVSDLAQRRLRRYGLDIENIGGLTTVDTAEHLLVMNDQDVILVFAFRKAVKQLRQVFAHADRVGAKIILITDTMQILSPRPAVTLASPRGEKNEFHTSNVPVLLFNSILLTMADRHPEHVYPYLDQFDTIIRSLDF